MLSRDHNILWLPESNGYPTRANLYAKRFRVTSIGSTEHWDRIGQFFAAFASGQTTASVALKRLVGHGPKNRFYRATRELGPRLQDRVHPRLPEPAGASHADPTRAPQGRTATRPRPVRPLRPTGPTGSARLRTPNRRGELPASHPRSYHPLADSGDRSCFERGGLGCGRSQLRVTVPYQPLLGVGWRSWDLCQPTFLPHVFGGPQWSLAAQPSSGPRRSA